MFKIVQKEYQLADTEVWATLDQVKSNLTNVQDTIKKEDLEWGIFGLKIGQTKQFGDVTSGFAQIGGPGYNFELKECDDASNLGHRLVMTVQSTIPAVRNSESHHITSSGMAAIHNHPNAPPPACVMPPNGFPVPNQYSLINQNALESTIRVIEQVPNQGKSMAEGKFRWLRIRMINVSAQHVLEFECDKFLSGEFDNLPAQPVQTGVLSTFYVHNNKLMNGSCGGAIWRVRSLGSGQICGHIYLTFSNPAVGNVKAKVTHRSTLKPDIRLIDKQYDGMNIVDKEITDAHVCLYQEDTDDRHIVVVFKDAHQIWQ